MGGWDQKSYESDLQYGRRKTQESADAYNNRNKHDNCTEINSDDVEAAGGCVAALLILPFLFLWGIVKLIFKLTFKIVSVVYLSIKYITVWIDDKLLNLCSLSKIKRVMIICLFYSAILSSSLYIIYINNFMGFYSSRLLVNTIKNDNTFYIKIKNTVYSYNNYSLSNHNNISLIGIKGNKIGNTIDIPIEKAAYEMINSNNNTPVDIRPELSKLIKRKIYIANSKSSDKQRVVKTNKTHKHKPVTVEVPNTVSDGDDDDDDKLVSPEQTKQALSDE